MTDQQVRLVFLGEAGSALRATDTVTAGTRRLSIAQKEQAATSRIVTAESGRQSQGMRTLERDIGSTSRGALAGSGIFRGLGRSIAFASASFLGGYGLIAVVRSTVGVLEEAGANAAITTARIKATGGAAGVSAKQIDVLAEATLRKTGYDKQAVIAAENVLLTFTEVRNEAGKGNDIYTRAVHVTADLARSIGEDLSPAAVQLGKALQDPANGLTSLARSSGAFTKAQREQIVALANSGEIVKAQTLILDTLEQKVGGVAAAYGDSAAGKIKIFRGEIRTLEEDLGKGLLPDMVRLVDRATKWTQALEANKPAQQRFRADIEGGAHAVGDIAHWLHDAADTVGGFKNALELLFGLKALKWAGEFVGGIQKLIGAAGAAGAGGEGLVGATAGVTGLLGSLRLLAARAATPIVITVIINKIIKDLTGTDILGQTLGPDQTAGGPGDLLPVKRGGKWVDPITGKPLNAAGQKYWNKQGGSAAPEMYPLATRGKIIGTPGQGTHSYTEGAGPGGFQWQDDQAVDIAMKPGEAVLAAEAGVIGNDLNYGGDSGRFSGWGFQLMADSGSTYFYKHLKSMSVAAGDRVKQGQVLGHGTTTGHLHFAKQGAQSAGDVLGRNQGPPPAGSKPPRRGRGGGTGPSQLQGLDLALAQAGVTKGTADDRAALQGLITYYKHLIANPNLPVTTRISDLNTEAGYISQLDALTPKQKGPTKASAAALVNIHHTLDAVSKLVDTVGLDKKFDPALDKINQELSSKFVTSATLAKIRNQLGDITKATKAELAKAKAAVAAQKQAFTDTWAQLAQDALDAFDKQTAEHVGPTRSMLDQLIGVHDQAQVDQAVTDTKKALDDALAGVNAQSDTAIVSQIRDMVGKAALANAIDKAQSDVLGIAPSSVSSQGLITQLQQLLTPGAGGPDPQAVKDAQAAYDDAIYSQKVFDLGKQADLEDSAYAKAREALRISLADQIGQWGRYFATIGEMASNAGNDLALKLAGFLTGQGVPYADVWKQIADFNASQSDPNAKTLSPGFTIPSSVFGGFGGGFGGAFADGGVVPGLLGQPKLILAHGGERVQTPAQQSAGQGPIQVHLHGDLALADRVHAVVQQDGRISSTISAQIGRSSDIRRRSGRM